MTRSSPWRNFMVDHSEQYHVMLPGLSRSGKAPGGYNVESLTANNTVNAGAYLD